MILQDIFTYLTNLGLVSTAWPLYMGYMPDDQDKCMGVFETGGHPPDLLNRENVSVTFQLRVRGVQFEYAAVRTQWQSVFNALQDSSLGNQTTYPLVQAQHYGPLAFNDKKGRPNITSNFRVLEKNI